MGWGLGSLNPLRIAEKAVSTVGDLGQGAIDTAKDIGAGLDKTVRSTLPGGWTTAALLGAGYYYSPEINAYLSADGATMAAGADVAAADAAAATAAEQAAAAAAAEQAAAAQAAEIAAQNAAWDAAAIDLANSASPVFATSAAAAGLTFKEALDYARAGLLVNALTGDPLGLSDVTGSGGNTYANQGFAQVPIPEDWKSPTYAASSAPIDLELIFGNQNMLGGTQWAGLPSQRNMSFNDIFAAGQQSTPMGTPVDINQIVSSILGQTTTS